MSAPKTDSKSAPKRARRGNEVRLVGRVSQDPEERVLPSGDSVWTFRVVVPRERAAGRSRQTVDAIECAAWSAPVAAVGEQLVGRRRGGGRRARCTDGSSAPAVRSASRVEVEMASGEVIRRAASG